MVIIMFAPSLVLVCLPHHSTRIKHSSQNSAEIQHPLTKTLNTVGTEGRYLSIMKPTARVINEQRKAGCFFSKIRKRQGCPLSPLTVDIVRES